MTETPAVASTAPGQGHLLRNMILFGRLLRAGGLDVTPGQMSDWIAALGYIDLAQKQDFRQATRAILVNRHADLPWFESAFDLFWQARDPRQLAELELGLLIQRTTERTRRTVVQKVTAVSGEAPAADARAPEEHRLGVYSAREVLRRKDFAELTAEELQEIRRLMAGMSWRLDTRRTRRRIPARRGAYPDLRRTLRRNLSRGGELVRLARQTRKRKRRPLVLICDVSGSMEPYARLLLHFVYALSHQDSARQGLEKVEAFVFGTRLTRITQMLRDRDPDRALRGTAREIQDWGGGTRTGEALHAFNLYWSRRVLGQGAVVLIISDGWDRGNIELLEQEMARLNRSCHRLLWLNPLLGSPSYQPLTRGIQAALPHVDDFLPVHNLQSLEQLARVLEQG